jgi:hypothetical protein
MREERQTRLGLLEEVRTPKQGVAFVQTRAGQAQEASSTVFSISN